MIKIHLLYMKLLIFIICSILPFSSFSKEDKYSMLKEKYSLVKENKAVLKNIIEISYLKKCLSLEMIDENKDLVNEFGKLYSFYKNYEDSDYLEKKKKYLTLDIYQKKIELPIKDIRLICDKI